MNVLAIGAHGDDLEEFCGGTLALYRRAGHNVWMCVATDGRGRPKGDPGQIAALRRSEAQASADVIGAQLLWLGIPDGDLTVDYDNRHKFIEAIRATEADIIITHPPDDYHPDHNAASRLTMDAAQVARTANYRSELPPLRKQTPVVFMDSELGVNFHPEEYVDITAVWEIKKQMLAQHRSQHMPGQYYDPNYVLSPLDELPIVRAARVMSEFRGLACSVQYAEGFRSWRVANRLVPARLLP